MIVLNTTVRIFVLVAAGLLVGCVQPEPGTSVEPQQVVAPRPVAPVAFDLCCTGLPDSGMWKCDPVLADLNGDGKMDLAALPRLGNGPRAWLGNGRGEWTESSAGLTPGTTSCGGGLEAADVNRDGHLDLVAADHCQGVYVYLGDGAGNWEMVVAGLWPSELLEDENKREVYQGAEDLAVGDVNDDGLLDIIAASSDEGGMSVYLGDGTGRGWKRVTSDLPTSGWALRVMLVDMDADGIKDLVASYNEGPRVWLRKGPNQWQAAAQGLPSPVIGGLYTGIAAGDVNHDGRVDLAAANWVDGPEVYLQQPDHTWQKTPDVFKDMKGGAVGLALGDIDRDGHLDMVVTGRLEMTPGFTRGVFALRGDGAGNWSYVPDSGLPPTGLCGMTGVTLADVNSDGILDVAAGSGLIVETAPGPRSPDIPWRLPVWRTRLTQAGSSVGK